MTIDTPSAVSEQIGTVPQATHGILNIPPTPKKPEIDKITYRAAEVDTRLLRSWIDQVREGREVYLQDLLGMPRYWKIR